MWCLIQIPLVVTVSYARLFSMANIQWNTEKKEKKLNAICSMMRFEVMDLYLEYMDIGHARHKAHV
jgi:hypothetical protein